MSAQREVTDKRTARAPHQGDAILRQPLVIALLVVPILIQGFFNSSLAYLLNRALGEKNSAADPSALIGASTSWKSVN